MFAEFIIARKLKRATNANHKHSFSFSRSFFLFSRLVIFVYFAVICAYVSDTLTSDLYLCRVRQDGKERRMDESTANITNNGFG